MHVMAGLMIDGDKRVLLAERPAGKHLAGFWEFPGGKLEAGELPIDALARELREELGIELQSAQPLIRVPWTYDWMHGASIAGLAYRSRWKVRRSSGAIPKRSIRKA